jgi:hypothetical protein
MPQAVLCHHQCKSWTCTCGSRRTRPCLRMACRFVCCTLFLGKSLRNGPPRRHRTATQALCPSLYKCCKARLAPEAAFLWPCRRPCSAWQALLSSWTETLLVLWACRPVSRFGHLFQAYETRALERDREMWGLHKPQD